jgi:hypothetical protein
MMLSHFRDPAVLFVLLIYLVGALSVLFLVKRKRVALVAALTVACMAALLCFIFGFR